MMLFLWELALGLECLLAWFEAAQLTGRVHVRRVKARHMGVVLKATTGKADCYLDIDSTVPL